MDFTHYDLHLDNILVFEPYLEKYIEFKYTLPSGKIITFKSKYVCKIIDYGRCYFNDKDSNEFLQNTQEVCATKECDPECGMDADFQLFHQKIHLDHFISYLVSNIILVMIYVLHMKHSKN